MNRDQTLLTFSTCAATRWHVFRADKTAQLQASKEKEGEGELEAARLRAQIVVLTAEVAEEKRLRVEAAQAAPLTPPQQGRVRDMAEQAAGA